mmetsp:Transcript_3538/g.7289  ORF Transcript_3538/g.7289 Transcript_3538/m.7289 type:complete len:234 (+) Transcript_3538:713-1414(+)
MQTTTRPLILACIVGARTLILSTRTLVVGVVTGLATHPSVLRKLDVVLVFPQELLRFRHTILLRHTVRHDTRVPVPHDKEELLPWLSTLAHAISKRDVLTRGLHKVLHSGVGEVLVRRAIVCGLVTPHEQILEVRRSGNITRSFPRTRLCRKAQAKAPISVHLKIKVHVGTRVVSAAEVALSTTIRPKIPKKVEFLIGAATSNVLAVGHTASVPIIVCKLNAHLPFAIGAAHQ